VVVRVRAAGVNFADVLVRQGRYPQPPELPDGARVGGCRRGGRAARDGGASLEEGAGFLLTFLTAWIPLTRQVRVREGGVVLVHAGSGGVGSAAIQLAKHLGARVVAT